MEDFVIIDNKTRIKIIFKVIEAKDLVVSSKAYLSIPQLQEGLMNLPQKLNQTKHSDETLNPIWNESFILEFYPEECTKFKIEVYNYSSIGKDKLIGSGNVPLDWIKKSGKNFYDEWIDLYREKKKERC